MKKREIRQARLSEQLLAAISSDFGRISSISTTWTSRSEKEGRLAFDSSERDQSRLSQSRIPLFPFQSRDDGEETALAELSM